jgi:Icc-related predicted phosphoesterase
MPSRSIDVARSAFQFGLRSLLHPASYRAPALSALSEFIHARQGAYDGIIISGDVATSGSAIDHNIAFDYLDKQPTKDWRHGNSPVLCRGETPVVLCPGNHDNYSDANPAPMPMNFMLKFGKFMPGFGLDRVGHHIFFEEQNVVALIFADFGFQGRADANGPLHLWGGGKVHQSVLNKLVGKTRKFMADPKLRDFRKSVIWMVHFAPYECKSSSLELTGREQVIEAAKRFGVKNIVCGHTHESSVFDEGEVKVYCSGAATSVECTNELHELTFDISTETLSRINYRWTRNNGAFVRV